MSESIEKQKLEIAVQERELATKEFFDKFSKGTRWVFIILAVMVIPIFFIAKYTVAAIYAHNIAKTQPTAHAAVVQPLAVDIVETKALTMAGDNYSAYAQIKNPNNNLVAEDLPYTFHFYDAAGKELGRDGGTTYLLGGEQKFLILPNIHLKSQPASVKVEITDPTWKRRLSVPNIVINTGIPQFKDVTDPTGFQVSGTIQNQSANTLDAVRISAIVRDSSGTIIAVSQRTENTIKSKEIRAYQMYWPIPLQSKVAGQPQIIVETNVLDPDNLK